MIFAKTSLCVAIASLSTVQAAVSYSYSAVAGNAAVGSDPVVSETVTINGDLKKVVSSAIATAGQQGSSNDGDVYGVVYDKLGEEIKLADNSTYINNAPDGVTVLVEGDKAWMVSHLENPQPGGIVLTQLSQDETTCKLTGVKHINVDSSSLTGGGGIWTPCAASRTPWNTHLGSEEYEPDARKFQDAVDADDLSMISPKNAFPELKHAEMLRYFGRCDRSDPTRDICDTSLPSATVSFYASTIKPYTYGIAWELSVDDFDTGAHTLTKHYALGRIARELSYIAPDEKTVYSTDDGTNVGFYRFIATNARQLNEGKLQCAKFTQQPNTAATGGSFDLEWITLGEITAAQTASLESAAGGSLVFSDIMKVGEYNATSKSCDVGTPVQAANEDTIECLEIETGKELEAAFLETRRTCALMGGTTEFNKWEGFTFTEKLGAEGTFFTAMSDIRKGMLAADETYDVHTGDHVQVDQNKCGCVYSLPVTATAESDYDVESMVPYTCGVEVDGSCSLAAISSPDNIGVLNNDPNVLLIAEDTSKRSENLLWAFDVADETNRVSIAKVPGGAEVSGPFDFMVGECSHLLFANQHPKAQGSVASIWAMSNSNETFVQDSSVTLPPGNQPTSAASANSVSVLAGSLMVVLAYCL